MDKPWLITDVANCAYEDTVVVVVKNKKQRKNIVDSLGHLGDRIVDFYNQDQLYSVSDCFGIPHQLMVMSYRDFIENDKCITQHLATSEIFDIQPILIYGRLWRKIPEHPSIIDGDDVTPELLLKMYWEARGHTFTTSDGDF